MKNEFPPLAMAILAKMAKVTPPKKSFSRAGYGESGENGEKAKPREQGRPVFRQIRQNSHSQWLKVKFHKRPVYRRWWIANFFKRAGVSPFSPE